MFKNRSSNRFLLIILVLLCIPVSLVNAATLTVVGRVLQGATNVLVGGSLYDVSFRDGTCLSLFDGCNEASDFTFQSAIAADAASAALLVQIFGAGDIYDTNPSKTRGI